MLHSSQNLPHPLYLSLHQWPWNKQLLPTQGSWHLNVQWPFMVNLNHQSSIQRLGSLHQFLCSGGSVSTKNITVLLGPNLCIVHRFGAHRLLKIIEDVQRCATIFILNDYVSDYRTRLLKLHILPLSMLYELNDMFFFCCCCCCCQIPQTSIQLLHHHRLRLLH